MSLSLRPHRIIFAVLFVLSLLAGVVPRAEAAAAEKCFPGKVEDCIAGRFLTHWESNGGLAINGYPISGEIQERLENGRIYVVQYFERTRLEFHPENPAKYQVLLGQFGRRVHPLDPSAKKLKGQSYFEETGHNLGGPFLAYWQEKGALAQFGFPLTEEFEQVLEDGETYTVQYFERARFELHPENPASSRVLLGQFGRAVYAANFGDFPVVLKECMPGPLVLEKDGTIHFRPIKAKFPQYICKFTLPQADPTNLSWVRWNVTTDAVIEEVLPDGSVFELGGKNGRVQLTGGGSYIVFGDPNEPFYLDIVAP